MKTRAFLLCFALAVALAASIAPAAPVVLGPLQNPNNFNRTAFGPDYIDYANPQQSAPETFHPATQGYEVRLPTGYDPAKSYGLICFIDWVNPGAAPPAAWQPILDKYDLIWMAATNVGNSAWTATRCGATIMGAFRMTELYPINPARIYAAGTSGGAQVASDLLLMRKDFFKGFIGLAGVSFNGDWLTTNGTIPNWNPPGRLDDTNTDNDVGTDYGWSDISSVVGGLNPTYSLLPNHPHAIITNQTDFRRTEIVGIYRYFFMNHGNPVKLIVRPGGHATYEGSSFEEAVRFMTAPNQVILRDRFENANLGVNNDPANTLEAGSGFIDRSMPGATAAEADYVYNSKTQKVLRLTPGSGSNAAIVEAKNRFNWTNPDGIAIDAKLRAETAAGNNQQIGLHVARGDSDDTPENNPGFHVYSNYGAGAKNRAVLVKADGTAIELAKWDHAGTTHPMSAAATDKMFWNSSLAPEYVGKTKDFRGEDIRVLLDNNGFQLTFIRPAANLETNFPGKVTLACKEAILTAGPNVGTLDGEEHPVVLQGKWSEMNLSPEIAALSFRHWKLLLSNRSLDGLNAAGNALVDEITLRANAEETNFTAPVITTPGDLTVNASSGQGAIVNFSVTATDDLDGPVSVSCVPPSGSALPIGTTQVLCTASDSNGNSSAATFNLTVQPNGFTPSPPDAPAAPSITPGLTAATISWQASNYASTYSVKRSSSSAGPFLTIASGLSVRSFTDTGLVYGVPAWYVVTASSAGGESPPSPPASVTTTTGTAVKADNAASLDTLASWAGNKLPGSGDIALWNDAITADNTVPIGAGTSLAGIRITNPLGNVTITPGSSGSLSLGVSGIDLQGSPRTLALTAPTVLTTNQSWTTGSFGAPGDTQLTAGAAISGSGKLTLPAGNTRVVALNGVNTFTGGFTLGAGAAVTVGSAAVVTSGNTTSSAFGAYNGGQTLTIEGGVIDHGGFGFHAKNVRVTGDFKFINNTRINFGGAFDMAGGTRTMTLVRSASNANTLVAGGNATLNVSSGGALAVSNGTLRIAADPSVPAGNFVVLTPQAGTAFTNNAGLVLGDKIYYGKAGTGTLNGATTVPSLTLEAGSVWDLSDGTNARNPQVNSLAGAGTVLNTWSSGGSGALHTLTIKGNTNAGRTDFSGRILDNGGTIFTSRTAGQTTVVKEGSTTQVFSGANSYTGTTSVNGGVLLVNGSIASPANLTVAAVATLGGTGSIASPAIVHGTLAPGDGPGTLTLTGSLAMNATSKLEWQLPVNATTGGDFLNAAAVTLASGAKLDLVFNAPGSTVSFTDPFWQSNRSWPVLSSTDLTGTFALGTISNDIASRAATAYGVFSLSHANNNVTLNWTAYSTRERWNLLHFNNLSTSGNAADSYDGNNDGENNLMEFATSQNPNATTRALTNCALTAAGLEFSYNRNRDAFNEGYTFTVEYSDNPSGPWIQFGPGTVITDAPLQSIMATIPAGPDGKRFVRLKITSP